MVENLATRGFVVIRLAVSNFRGCAMATKTASADIIAPTATVPMKAVFEQIAEEQNLPKKQAHAMLADMVSAVTDHLKKGDRIRINGLGILEVKKREARTGRNPATGESIQIAASKKVHINRTEI